MHLSLRRALGVAVAATVLAAPVAASATEFCLTTVCLNATVPVVPALGEPPWGDGGGGSGMLCLYTKTYAPPPPDWTGVPGSPGPYVFVQTWDWGQQHPGQFNSRWCIPACPTVPNVTVESLNEVLQSEASVAGAFADATCGVPSIG